MKSVGAYLVLRGVVEDLGEESLVDSPSLTRSFRKEIVQLQAYLPKARQSSSLRMLGICHEARTHRRLSRSRISNEASFHASDLRPMCLSPEAFLAGEGSTK